MVGSVILKVVTAILKDITVRRKVFRQRRKVHRESGKDGMANLYVRNVAENGNNPVTGAFLKRWGPPRRD
jgi:hypothetical protein